MDHRSPRFARPSTLCVTLPSTPRQGFSTSQLHAAHLNCHFLPAGNISHAFAGVGTTFVILTAGFSSGLVFTKAAFDDTRAATRADPRPPPSVRVILPAYGEPAPSAIPVSDQPQTEAMLATPNVQTAPEASTPVTQVFAPDPRTVERNLRAERRKQAERKARKVAAAKARQEMKAQTQHPSSVMAFGGDSPHFFGN